VWEGWHREVSPYPDQSPLYDSTSQNRALVEFKAIVATSSLDEVGVVAAQ